MDIKASVPMQPVYLIKLSDFELFATISSLILSILAIWLSLVFYKLSSESSREATKALEKIETGIDKMQTLFDKFYSGNLALLTDTYTDLRSHIFNAPFEKSIRKSADVEAQQAIGDLEKVLEQEVQEVLASQDIPISVSESISIGMKSIVKEGIIGTKLAQEKAYNTTVVDAVRKVIGELSLSNQIVFVQEVMLAVSPQVPRIEIIEALSKMRQENEISLQPDSIVPSSIVTIISV